MTVFTTDDVAFLREEANDVHGDDRADAMCADRISAHFTSLADRLAPFAVDPTRPYFDRFGVLCTPESA